jgi:hypothetical protein
MVPIANQAHPADQTAGRNPVMKNALRLQQAFRNGLDIPVRERGDTQYINILEYAVILRYFSPMTQSAYLIHRLHI